MNRTEERSFGWRQFEALGTYAYLATSGDADEAAGIAQRVLEDVDRTCSRFRPDSDLSLANRQAGTWTRVDPLLAAAVTVAVAAAEASEGLVDPCLGVPLDELGYDADFTLVQARTGAPARLRTRHPVGRWRELEVDAAGGVKVPAGVRLDLGATAKAWASDLVALSLVEATGQVAVVSLGGDVRIATPPGTTDFEGWPVSVTESPTCRQGSPGRHEEPELITLGSGGLATSSSQVRRWSTGGVQQHHLVDPRTGRPTAGPWRTVTATGPTCVAANIASTAAVVLGTDAVAWLGAREVDARLVDTDGRVTRLGSWPAPAEDLR